MDRFLKVRLDFGRNDIEGGAASMVWPAKSLIRSVSVSSISEAKSRAVQPFVAEMVGSDFDWKKK